VKGQEWRQKKENKVAVGYLNTDKRNFLKKNGRILGEQTLNFSKKYLR